MRAVDALSDFHINLQNLSAPKAWIINKTVFRFHDGHILSAVKWVFNYIQNDVSLFLQVNLKIAVAITIVRELTTLSLNIFLII